MKSTNIPAYRSLLREMKRLRVEANVTQQSLAALIEKPQSFVSKVETGERRLDLVELVQWARAIHADPSELVEFLSDRMVRRRVFLKR